MASFEQALDEATQKKLLGAVEKGDLGAFNQALFGKKAPGFFDYLAQTGEFTMAQDMFHSLLKDRLRLAQEQAIGRSNIPPPTTFGEASQQIPLGMSALGIQPPQVPLIPPGGSMSRTGQTVFNEKEYADLLNAALMKNMPTIPSGRPGEVIATPQVSRGEMVPDYSAPLTPVQQAQLMQFAGALPQQAAQEVVKPPSAPQLHDVPGVGTMQFIRQPGGGVAAAPIPGVPAAQPDYKSIPDKAVAMHMMANKMDVTPENIKKASDDVKRDEQSQKLDFEKKKRLFTAGTEGVDDASLALWGVPNSEVTGQVITEQDVPKVTQSLQNMWRVTGIASPVPKIVPGMTKTQLNIAVKDKIGIEKSAAQGAAAEQAKPIETSLQDKIGTLENNLSILDDLQSTWARLRPGQRAKFVGIVNFNVGKLKQFVDQQITSGADPAFASFAAKVYMAKNLAFQSGGKQLTPFEASVVFGYTPTGEEMSVADFEAKMQEAGENTRNILDITSRLATVPRREIRGQIQETLKKYPQRKNVTQPQTSGRPNIGTIEGGYRFTGGDPSKKENWQKVK